MLKIITTLEQLHFGNLMYVYEESNLENAGVFFPDMDFNLAVLNTEQNFYAYLRDIFFTTEGAFYAVWEQKGAYVCALRMEPYQDGLLLEALETAPLQRKKGYATDLLKAVCAYLKRRGCCVIYSHVSKDNAASLRAHAACGFHRLLEYAVYIDGSVRMDSCTLCMKEQELL